MTSVLKLAAELARRLEDRIRPLPDEFYRTLAYTRTGQNLTHPVTVGLLATIVAELPGVAVPTIDHRLNGCNGTKFQPDILAVSKELKPILAIDYESLDSSDARVPQKNWGALRDAEVTGCGKQNE